MKDFGNKKFLLSDSAFEVKLVYSGFLIFAFIGYLTIVLIGFLRVGPDYQSVVTHYRGSELEEMAFPRPFGQMLEEAHFHAFIEGVILLVLAHLFVSTRLNNRIKIVVILLAFASTLVDLVSPWLVRYVWAGFAGLQIASWVIMGASAFVLIAVPLHQMWWGRTRRKPVA